MEEKSWQLPFRIPLSKEDVDFHFFSSRGKGTEMLKDSFLHPPPFSKLFPNVSLQCHIKLNLWKLDHSLAFHIHICARFSSAWRMERGVILFYGQTVNSLKPTEQFLWNWRALEQVPFGSLKEVCCHLLREPSNMPAMVQISGIANFKGTQFCCFPPALSICAFCLLTLGCVLSSSHWLPLRRSTPSCTITKLAKKESVWVCSNGRKKSNLERCPGFVRSLNSYGLHHCLFQCIFTGP